MRNRKGKLSTASAKYQKEESDERQLGKLTANPVVPRTCGHREPLCAGSVCVIDADDEVTRSELDAFAPTPEDWRRVAGGGEP